MDALIRVLLLTTVALLGCRVCVAAEAVTAGTSETAFIQDVALKEVQAMALEFVILGVESKGDDKIIAEGNRLMTLAQMDLKDASGGQGWSKGLNIAGRVVAACGATIALVSSKTDTQKAAGAIGSASGALLPTVGGMVDPSEKNKAFATAVRTAMADWVKESGETKGVGLKKAYAKFYDAIQKACIARGKCDHFDSFDPTVQQRRMLVTKAIDAELAKLVE